MSEWPMVKLGDLGEFINGFAFKPSDWSEDGTPIIRIQNLTNPQALFNRTTKRVKDVLYVEPGDLLVSWSATLGVFRWQGKERAVLNQHIFKVVSKPIIENEFLEFSLKFALQQVEKYLHGATMRHVNRQEFLDLKIPLPPLGEQKRIAEILGGVSKAIHVVEQQIETANQLEKSLFNQFRRQYSALCSPIKNICKVQTGATPSRKNSAYYDGGIPWVKTGEVNGGKIEETEEYITELAVQETNCRKFPIGTILVAMYGQGATRGKVGILNCAAATNQACAALIALACEDQEYIFAVLRNCYDELRNLGRGGTQPNLNLTLVKNFEIPWPEEFAREEFSQKWRELDNLRHLLHRKLSLLQELQKSLANRAFAGLL
jgi:type I restriction-modification system, specificity subunit